MKIQIDEKGRLQIERAGAMKAQWCPYSEGVSQALCGDWCPMFGEPDWKIDPENGKRYDHHIRLCRTILYGTIEDKRGAQ